MEPTEKIGNMDAILFALTLEVVLMQMRILEGSTELRARQWKIIIKSQKQQCEKLVRDRKTVNDVIRRTLIEVSERGEWHTLQNAVKMLKHQAELAVTMRRHYEEHLRIGNMDAILFALTLEVVLMQMRILEGSTELRARQWKIIIKSQKQQCEKLVRDRKTVNDVIRRTLIEVSERGEWHTLQNAVKMLKHQAELAVTMRRHYEEHLRIGNMDAILFALTLEVVLMQMRILEGSTELRARQWKIIIKSQKQQCEKLVRDRKTVNDVIRRTLIEVSERGEWHTLQNAVKMLKHQAELAVTMRRHYEEHLRIGNMDAILFALTLEVVLMQMRILEGSTELRARQWKIIIKSQKQQCEKLVRDRKTVNDVIRRTLIEVSERGEWHTLQNAVKMLKHQAELAVTMRRHYEEHLRSNIVIADELDEKRRQWAVELRNADLKTAILRDKMNDDQLNANARLAYAEKWILARAEALELQHNQPIPPPPRLDHEKRVHEEIMKAYTVQIQEREETLKYWERRHAVDTKDIKARLAAKSEELRIAVDDNAELQKLYNLHEGEMRAWLTFKRERAARIAREKHVRESATRIQAWWRGTMVRRALGQFKFLRNIKKSATKKKK